MLRTAHGVGTACGNNGVCNRVGSRSRTYDA
jgi:hypothetical protein